MGPVDSVQKSPADDDPAAGVPVLGEGVGEIRDSGCGEGFLVGRAGGSTSENNGLADFEMNGVSSLLKMKESNRKAAQGGGSKVEDLNSLLGGMDVGGDVEVGVGAGSARDGGGIGENGGSLDLNSDGLVEDVFEHQYSVGDFVWGKIKNHPWWPGQVYDPSDASEYALKHRTSGNKILVAYFGDGTFAWCHPSQLKPFEETFDAFSKQSTSKNFSNAVKAAVDEICRVVSSRMTCPCAPTTGSADSSVGRKLAVNSGIKEGVVVPDVGIEKLAVCRLGTPELISNLRKMACMRFAFGMLYSAVLRNSLIPFYKMKGVSRLPTYYEPVPIPGLEDRGDAGVPFQGPVVEEGLSPAQKESTVKKCVGTSGDEASLRRKEKSILELLGLNGEGADLKASTKKMEDELAAESNDASGSVMVEVKRRGRKKKASGGAENGGSDIKAGSEGPVGDRGGNLDKGSYLRERKKSKYLSPPFTDVTKGRKRKDKEAEPLNASGIAGVAEKMKRAADHLMGTPPIFEKKVDDAKVPENPDRVGDDEISEQRHVTDKTEELKATASDVLNEVRDAALDPNQAKEAGTVSDDVEMFLPLYRSSVFRNGSNFKNFNKRKPGRKRKSPETEPGSTTDGARIDQSSDTKPQNEVTANLDAESPKKIATEEVVPKPDGKPRKLKSDAKPQKKRATDEATPKSDTKPRKKKETQEAGLKSDAKPQKKRGTEDATTPKPKATPKSRLLGKVMAKDDVGWLLITFKQASSLPSKEDLIAIYTKYGKLDENETVVHYNSKYALVVFEKISDAEEALKCSKTASPFGSSKTEFELLRANSTPYGTGEQQTSVPRKRGRPRKVAVVDGPSVVTGEGDTSEVILSMKRKLEKISSVLDKSGGRLSKKVKSQLKDEIKGLLELVSSTSDASSSS